MKPTCSLCNGELPDDFESQFCHGCRSYVCEECYA